MIDVGDAELIPPVDVDDNVLDEPVAEERRRDFPLPLEPGVNGGRRSREDFRRGAPALDADL